MYLFITHSLKIHYKVLFSVKVHLEQYSKIRQKSEHNQKKKKN